MLLNKELEDKIVDLLIDDGLVDSGLVQNAYNEVRKSGQPILSVLKAKNIADDDRIQHATAVVLNIKYADLRNIRFDRQKLLKVPQDVAERARIVPLGERDGQLYVAMIDTSNVQRMDYISTLVNMPIHGVMTSEAGIDNAMSQYVADLKDVNKVAEKEEQAASENADVITITQDSPIAKALMSK